MKILANPRNGAIIHDFWYKDELYFSSENHEEFKPKTVLQFEDDFADYLLGIYTFLEEKTATEAKKFQEEMKKREEFKCDHEGCDFTTTIAMALQSHQKTHVEVSDIPVVKGKAKDDLPFEKSTVNIQDEIESQARAGGLEGEGLQRDFV